MAKLLANSGDPDKTLQSAVSDLGLHCLSFTLLGVSRLTLLLLNTTCHVLANSEDPDQLASEEAN